MIKQSNYLEINNYINIWSNNFKIIKKIKKRKSKVKIMLILNNKLSNKFSLIYNVDGMSV